MHRPGGLLGTVAEYRRLHGDLTLPNYGTRELISAGMVATGLTLVSLSAWPRRPREAPS